ncbi:MAG: DUF5011 domain-containing protein [Lachnospiraceae bacterium]|nr:DUF5011 domain-containing protein [Lachnospiraceae bacterium]
MKRILYIAIALCFVAGCGMIYLKYSEDRNAPVITWSDEFVYLDGMDYDELLVGVIATDEEEGDVSDTLTVERVVTDAEKGKATVTYAAKDSRNNISKAARILTYEAPEEESETETETEPETEPPTEPETEEESETDDASSDVVVMNAGGETDSDRILESGTEASGLSADSETETEEDTLSEAEETSSPYAPRLTLSTNRVTIQKGEAFDPVTYVEAITDDYDNIYTLWRRIQVEGTYDTSVAGIYQLVYYVTDTSGYTSNRETLLLIVEDPDAADDEAD